jgi:hypothetical protein
MTWATFVPEGNAQPPGLGLNGPDGAPQAS